MKSRAWVKKETERIIKQRWGTGFLISLCFVAIIFLAFAFSFLIDSAVANLGFGYLTKASSMFKSAYACVYIVCKCCLIYVLCMPKCCYCLRLLWNSLETEEKKAVFFSKGKNTFGFFREFDIKVIKTSAATVAYLCTAIIPFSFFAYLTGVFTRWCIEEISTVNLLFFSFSLGLLVVFSGFFINQLINLTMLPALLITRPDLSAFEMISQAQQMVRGFKMGIILFHLHYIIYLPLALLIFPIPLIFQYVLSSGIVAMKAILCDNERKLSEADEDEKNYNTSYTDVFYTYYKLGEEENG